jgi:hypothetical protein
VVQLSSGKKKDAFTQLWHAQLNVYALVYSYLKKYGEKLN